MIRIFKPTLKPGLVIFIFICCLSVSLEAFAEKPETIDSDKSNDAGQIDDNEQDLDYTSLSLLELMTLSVYSESKREKDIFKTPSSITVIDSNDISRNSHEDILDLITDAPGFDLVKINSSSWAIGARGFNNRLSSFILPLVDGRNILSPMYGGAYWDSINIIPENIEKIELIRSSGVTSWGNNALNGVINIITKDTKDTKGLILGTSVGSNGLLQNRLSYSDNINLDNSYRIYAKATHRAAISAKEYHIDPKDTQSYSFGGRFDSSLIDDTKLKITFDKNMVDAEILLRKNSLVREEGSNPEIKIKEELLKSKVKSESENLAINFEKIINDDLKLLFKFYYDDYKRDELLLSHETTNFDYSLAIEAKLFKSNTVNYEINLHNVSDNTKTKNNGLTTNLKRLSYTNFAILLNDDIELLKDKLFLSLGLRHENNYYDSSIFQPSSKLYFTPSSKSIYWLSVSKAVKTPFRMETDSILDMKSYVIKGNENIKGTELISTEAGYRAAFGKTLYIDAALYYNIYKDIHSLRKLSDSKLIPSLSIYIPAEYQISNDFDANLYGFELGGKLVLTDIWDIGWCFSMTGFDYRKKDSQAIISISEGDSIPEQGFAYLAKLKSGLKLHDGFDLSSSIYYKIKPALVDGFSNPDDSLRVKSSMKDHLFVDYKIRWRNRDKNIEISFKGENRLIGKADQLIDPLGFVNEDIDFGYQIELIYKGF